ELAVAVEGKAGRTLADHFAGLTSAAEAVEALHAQRTLWRSHPAEALLLLHLAALEIAAVQPVKAVELWQELVAGAGPAGLPTRQEDSLRRQLMHVLEGDDNAALTLAALALTREFPRLVEQGSDGPLLRARLDQRLADSAFGRG